MYWDPEKKDIVNFTDGLDTAIGGVTGSVSNLGTNINSAASGVELKIQSQTEAIQNLALTLGRLLDKGEEMVERMLKNDIVQAMSDENNKLQLQLSEQAREIAKLKEQANGGTEAGADDSGEVEGAVGAVPGGVPGAAEAQQCGDASADTRPDTDAVGLHQGAGEGTEDSERRAD